MYFKIEQTEKELYSAKFTIYSGEKAKLGDVTLTGTMVSPEANIKINLENNESIILKYGYRDLKERLKATFSNGFFRPYSIIINNTEIGRVGSQYRKESMGERIRFTEIVLQNVKYETYLYGLGEKGIVYSIYSDSKEIGEIHKESLIINGLHHYEIKCINNQYFIPVLIQCIYAYVFSDYVPGKKIIKGKTKEIIITKNEFLKTKYNPDFWNSVWD